MDFFDIVEARRSVRAFRPAAVEPEKLAAILKAANDAPSAGNLQAYEVYLARKQSDRRALAAAAWDQDFIAQAPLALVFCADPERSAGKYGQRGVRLYAVQDATIACAFAMLAATALGLASVWVGAFDHREVHRAIHAPESVVPVAILPIGYAAERPEHTPRRSITNLVHEL
jgi:nitroreductase